MKPGGQRTRWIAVPVLLCLLLGLAFFVLDGWLTPAGEAPIPLEHGSSSNPSEDPALHGRGAPDAPNAAEADPSPAEAAARTGWWIAGRVVEIDGPAIVGARVTVEARRGEVVEYLSGIETDAEGRYRVDVGALRAWPPVVRATARLVARARAPGFVPDESDEVVVSPDAFEQPVQVDLALARGSVVEGRVLDEAGAPAAGAWVALRQVGKPADLDARGVDAEGRYVLGTPSSGAHRVYASGSAGGWAESDTLVLEGGGTTAAPDLVLRAADVIQGVVVTRDGRALPDITVWGGPLETGAKGSFGQSAKTDADGRFRLLVSEEGRYLVKAGGSLGGSQAECDAGDRDVRLVVKDAVLVVRIVDPEGRPLPGSVLVARGWQKDNADLLDQVMAGTLSMDEAREGAYFSSAGNVGVASGVDAWFVAPESFWHLAAYVEGAVPAEAVVKMKTDEQVAEVTLVVRAQLPTGTLLLDLQGADGQRIERFTVEVQSLSGVELAGARADVGTPLPPLPAGRVRLRIAPDAGTSWLEQRFGLGTFHLPLEEVVEIPRDGTLRTSLRAKQGGRFRLQITYPDGERPKTDDLRVTVKPMDDAEADETYVGMWVKGSGDDTIVTSEFDTDDPRLNVHLLEARDYRLEVKTQAHGTHARTLRILPGEITDVVLDVR